MAAVLVRNTTGIIDFLSIGADQPVGFIYDASQWLISYVPLSFPAYFCILLLAYLIKLANPKAVQVSQNLQFVHNVFLAAQSAGLMLVVYFLFADAAASVKDEGGQPLDANLFSNPAGFFEVFVGHLEERVRSKYFNLAMVCFLSSKLYEIVDTVILILNGKPLLLLHLWHHATTFAAFYTGLFTAAGYWIGMLNSFIHVIMYLYYAKIPGTKHIAKYITSLQITHLFGGVLCNLVTLTAKPGSASAARDLTYLGVEIPTKRFATFNLFICFSYFFLFLAFFSKKYHKNGSIWTLFGMPKGVLVAVQRMQTQFFPATIRQYLVAQGLLVNMGEKKES